MCFGVFIFWRRFFFLYIVSGEEYFIKLLININIEVDVYWFNIFLVFIVVCKLCGFVFLFV